MYDVIVRTSCGDYRPNLRKVKPLSPRHMRRLRGLISASAGTVRSSGHRSFLRPLAPGDVRIGGPSNGIPLHHPPHPPKGARHCERVHLASARRRTGGLALEGGGNRPRRARAEPPHRGARAGTRACVQPKCQPRDVCHRTARSPPLHLSFEIPPDFFGKRAASAPRGTEGRRSEGARGQSGNRPWFFRIRVSGASEEEADTRK